MTAGRPLTFRPCHIYPSLHLPSSMTLASSCKDDAEAAVCGGAAISDTSIPGGGREQVGVGLAAAPPSQHIALGT